MGINIKEFMSENLANTFTPFAFFDKHLDCIRVQLEDCSVTEKRLNKYFTILQKNHVEVEKHVGFTIKGIRFLFEHLGLPKNGAVKLGKIIDAIVKAYPDSVGNLINMEFGDYVREHDLTVEMDLAA